MLKKLLPLLLIFIGSLVNIPVVSAQGDLMIMPKRLVFEGRERSKEINLANSGQDTAIYAISFINYKMTKNGNFELLETPEEGQRFAMDFLRYFPRRVTLAPNEAQTIRVQLSRSGNLEPGEYRSHMYFRAIEKQTALGSGEKKGSDGISINIRTVFGISIPVIIRHGEATTAIQLSNLRLDRSGNFPKVFLDINRTGNMSVYGDIKAVYISPKGKTTLVGEVKGVSVYTPNKVRSFNFELREVEGIDLDEGKLQITYFESSGSELASIEKQL